LVRRRDGCAVERCWRTERRRGSWCVLTARWPYQSVDLRQVAADAEAAIAAEASIAIEYRKTGKFDRQPQFRMAIGTRRRGDRP